MESATMHQLRLLSAHYDATQGVILDMALRHFHAISPLCRANIVASIDTEQGEIVPSCLTDHEAALDARAADHVRSYKVEAGIDKDVESEEQ